MQARPVREKEWKHAGGSDVKAQRPSALHLRFGGGCIQSGPEKAFFPFSLVGLALPLVAINVGNQHRQAFIIAPPS